MQYRLWLWWGNGAMAAAVAAGIAKVSPWPVAALVGVAASGMAHRRLCAFLRTLLSPEEGGDGADVASAVDGASKADLRGHLNAAAYWTGLNTTGGNRHRNATHDLRPSPVCPKSAVSPWCNSTIGD